MTADVLLVLCGLDLPNTREGRVLTSGPFGRWCDCGLFVTEGGVSANSNAVCSCVTEVGNFGKKKWLHLLSIFDKRVLRRIFGPKRDEVTEEWRKLHNEVLNDLYSPTTLRVISSRK